eukprot:TRINITY_DN33156_c0_g1_i1.p1 TRINITY_DN33156_c0_g1~~TRINITY_DN33156_c0_g1_i1.p1  ORF type:complete len:195 (+),score=25.47 TRINITY_DN33156_c0_g1_i1:55-639(+)
MLRSLVGSEMCIRDRAMVAPRPHSFETAGSFRRRAVEFKKFLGGLEERNVLVVSHGGLLSTAFGKPSFPNCGFRVVDVRTDGSAVAVRTKTEIPCEVEAPVFRVISVVRSEDLEDGHYTYQIVICMDDFEFVICERESWLREFLHDMVKERLGKVAYQRSELNGKFPYKNKVACACSARLASLLLVLYLSFRVR